MSLHIITGKIGDGKSYSAVCLIRDYLMKTERHVYTNLPIKPDALAASFEGFSWPTAQRKVTRNLHLLTEEQVPNFWWYSQANAVFVIDETALHFPSSDVRERNKEDKEQADEEVEFLYREGFYKDTSYRILAKTRKRNLLTLHKYLAIMRHYLDDVYFICQSAMDIDGTIRRKAQFVWISQNSLRTPLVPKSKILAGITWPIHFFWFKQYSLTPGLRSGADFSGALPLCVYTYRARSKIFECYDSFSQAHSEGLPKAIREGSTSGDFNQSRVDWRRWFHSVGPFLAFFFCLSLGAITGFYLIYSFLLTTSKYTSPPMGASKSSKVSVEGDSLTTGSLTLKSNSAGGASADPTPTPTPEPLTVRAVLAREVVLSDGSRVALGQQLGETGLHLLSTRPVVWVGPRGSEQPRLGMVSTSRLPLPIPRELLVPTPTPAAVAAVQ